MSFNPGRAKPAHLRQTLQNLPIAKTACQLLRQHLEAPGTKSKSEAYVRRSDK